MFFRLILLGLIWIESVCSYSSNSGSWSCLESNRSVSLSCLPGYLIDFEHVVFESSQDETCAGPTRCHLKEKHPLVLTCNRKRTCSIDIQQLSFQINATCGMTRRFYAEYRCLPSIQEQKDFLCETLNPRRASLSDINLSCTRNYQLYLVYALIGLSTKPDPSLSKSNFKCHKDTPSLCQTDVTETFRSVCQRSSHQDQCKIRYQDRPNLVGCDISDASNYSMVEYLCVPGPSIAEDLPQLDLCSTEKVTIHRGIFHFRPSGSTSDRCRKRLVIADQSRIRLVLLDRSTPDAVMVHFSNPRRTFPIRDYLDVNGTEEQMIEIEAITPPISIYFQVDSPQIEKTASTSAQRSGAIQRGKAFVRRYWLLFTIVLISLIVLLLLLAIVLCFCIHKKRRDEQQRLRHRAYMKSLDNPRTEPSHLSKGSPITLPSVTPSPARPYSASSTMIIHQTQDAHSDREALINSKPVVPPRLGPSEIDDFYEEIKEQQQQTALALSRHGNPNESFNPYLEAKYSPDEKKIEPIRNHHETDKHYQQPRSDDPNQ